MIIKKYIANENDENQTLLKFVKKVRRDLNLSIIYKLFRNKDISLNNKRVNNFKLKIKQGDEIVIYEFKNKSKQRDNFNLIENPQLDVIYEDQNILIVDKPFNLEVHSNYNLCLDNLVKSYLFFKNEYNPLIENSFVISHVHRIDKLTAGLVIYCKNKKSHEYFSNIINDKDKINKIYIAKLETKYKGNKNIFGYIKYNPILKKSIFSENYLDNYKECSIDILDVKDNFIQIKLNTGRKHQIRSIMSFYKCPIIGDFRYGAKKINDIKICLIAKEINFKNLDSDYIYLNNKVFNSRNNL